MLYKEMLDLLKAKKTKLLLVVILIIPFVDLCMNVWECYGDYWLHSEAYSSVPSWIFHPSKAAFLSGSSIGHISQMLLIWLLPFYLLFIYGDAYIREQQIGYHNIISARKTNLSIFVAKSIVGFLVGFIPVFLSVSLNYILCLLFFKQGTSFGGMELFIEDMSNKLLVVSIQHPITMYIFYILLFSIIAGICGAMCVSLSFCIKSYKMLYTICFAVWFIQIISPYSITYAIQPFCEYGFSKILPAIGIYVVVAFIVMIIGYIYKVKYEEI